MYSIDLALDIIKKLKSEGYKAYFCGGCVRDKILGIPPKDYDIVTDATPKEVSNIFRSTVLVGAKFGVVRVIKNKETFEVATFRKDGIYKDGRRPEDVSFCDEQEDAKRRDFTINGLFYDPLEDKKIDYVGGIQDIKLKRIRTIGNPKDRFFEDYLRILRAIRFSCQLDFDIEDNTWREVKKFSDKIVNVSSERIRDELLKMLKGANPEKAVLLLEESSILKVLFPEIASLRDIKESESKYSKDIFNNMILMFKYGKPIKSDGIALAVFLHSLGKIKTAEEKNNVVSHNYEIFSSKMAKKILKFLKLPNKILDETMYIISNHVKFSNIQNLELKTLKRFLGNPNFNTLLEFHRLYCLANNSDLNNYDFAKRKYKELKESLNPSPLISGSDLIKMGFKPGPIFKDIFNFIEDNQLEGLITTKKEAIDSIKISFGSKHQK